jgi:hypothetical protein
LQSELDEKGMISISADFNSGDIQFLKLECKHQFKNSPRYMTSVSPFSPLFILENKDIHVNFHLTFSGFGQGQGEFQDGVGLTELRWVNRVSQLCVAYSAPQ